MTESKSVFNDNLLAGKTALITGGGSGINRGIAHRFAVQGAKVVIVGRTQEKLDAVVKEIKDAGGEAIGCSADVRDFDALAEAAEKGVQAFGRYDIVVAGAAGNFVAPAAQLSANGFGAVVDIDLKGTFNTWRVCFDRRNEKGCNMIALSAPQATHPAIMQAHACSAKAGIEMLTKTLALEWGQLKVRVNGISPGFVENTVGGDLFKGSDGGERVKKALPVPRFCSVDEIAEVALFLVSDAAAYITGQIIAVDGGVTLMGGGAMGQ